MQQCRRGVTCRQSSYSVESTIERPNAGRQTSPLYVGGSKSLENLIREARREMGQVEEGERRQVGECQGRAWDDEEIYLDMTALRHRKEDERSNVQRTRRKTAENSDYLEMEQLTQHLLHLR